MYYILLDEPFNPSTLEPGAEYPKLFISWMSLDLINQSIRMGLEFGDTVSGVEIRGEWSQTMTRTMDGDDWVEFVSQTSSGIRPMVEDFQQYMLDKLVAENVVSGIVEYEEFEF